MFALRVALLSALVPALLALACCGQSQQPFVQGDSLELSASPQAQLPPAGALPPFPVAGVPAPRGASFLVSTTLAASQANALGPDAVVRGDLPGDPLELSAGEHEASWALYKFEGVDNAFSGLQLTVRQTDEDGLDVPAQPLWLGWANHASQRWIWTLLPGSASGDTIELGGGEEAVSLAMAVDIAVLAFDDAHLFISELELSRSCEPAVDNFTAQGSASAVTLNWDPVLDGEGYRLYYAEAGDANPEYLPLIDFDDPNITELVHSDIFPVGQEAAYGVPYSYAIEVVYTDSIQLSCDRAEAARVLPAPQDVRASNRLHGKAIRVRWSPVDDATSYKIYRDGEEMELDEVPAGMNFFQDGTPAVWDGEPHSYSIRAVSPGGDSFLSAPALGSAASYQGFTIDSSVSLESTSPEAVLYNGVPVVSSFDYESNNPFVSISTGVNPQVFTDFANHAVDTTNDGIGASHGLAVIGGRLAQAFSYKGNNSMHYVRALVDQPASAADWELTLINDMDTGALARLASVGGLPAVAYVDNDDAISFGIAGSTTPASPADWTLFNIENDGHYSAPQLMELGGMAALSYIHSSDALMTPTYDLHFARATTAAPDGPEDFVSFAIDSAAECRYATALLALDGRPVIAYTDHSGASPVIKLAIGLSEAPDSEADFELRTIFTGLMGANIVDLSMALCSSGLIMSFTEAQDGPAGDYHLQVLRSNNMPPLDELDCMTQDFGGAQSDPAGGQSSWAFALETGAAALVYGQYNGGSMRTELVYLAESN